MKAPSEEMLPLKAPFFGNISST